MWCGGARELSIGALHASIEDFLLDLQAAEVSVPIITPGPVYIVRSLETSTITPSINNSKSVSSFTTLSVRMNS